MDNRGLLIAAGVFAGGVLLIRTGWRMVRTVDSAICYDFTEEDHP